MGSAFLTHLNYALQTGTQLALNRQLSSVGFAQIYSKDLLNILS